MRPNILFFLIDGLRADQCYGKDKTSVTPNLDGLIQKGMYFTNAYSSVDGTILSLNTIFNGDFQIGNAARYQKVSLKQNNLIDVLKKNGYRVYGSLPNFASFNTLLQQFENKTDEEIKGKNGEVDPVAAQFKQEKIEESHSEYEKNKATFPTGLAQKIIQILESTEKQEPYFCYFHIFDLHPLREGKMPIGIEDFGGEEYGNSTYAKTVSSIDFWLGKILENINLDNTILILTSDHGERIPYDNVRSVDFEPKLENTVSIGKKILPKSAHNMGGKFLYNIRKSVGKRKLEKSNKTLTNYEKRSRATFDNVSLFDEMLHIPLLFVNNKIKSQMNNQNVHHIDILPTLCGLIDIKLNHAIGGRDLIRGISEKTLENKPIYIRTRPYIDEKMDKRDSLGLRTDEYKYFRFARNPNENVHLYNLKDDPYENENIAKKNKELILQFEEKISEFEKNDLSDEEEVSEEEIEYELKKMGYV